MKKILIFIFLLFPFIEDGSVIFMPYVGKPAFEFK